MTNEQINAAIAKQCDWKDVWRAPNASETAYFVGTSPSGEFLPVPNYCTDLNEMHEAEKVLTQHQNESIYPRNLGAWRNPTKPIYATARQRAEAFLRTLGKWEEVQE